MKKSKIIGTGMYVPPYKLTNQDLEKMVDTSNEWIISRTGIEERRICKDEETTDIAFNAAVMAIKNAGIKAEEIDMIIMATITSENLTPSGACEVQKKLGAINATAFDINAACSGFIYGLTIADSFICSGGAKNVLVVGAEVLSKIVDWKDRNTCVLFGDGAGAALLTQSESEGIMGYVTKSNGDKGEYLKCASRQLNEDNSILNNKFVTMNGKEVFKFATKAMVDSVEEVLKKSNTKIEDIKYIIPHQANKRIIEFAASKLNLPLEKFYINLNLYGNTSSASIPIALSEVVEKAMVKKGDKIILVGFGGGLTYGCILIEW
ncbi:ketoacyl-ACP synthase III [Clostridium sp. MSJ-4]|uniref:Beta-ketoacyl-[acyl-carrier-protein] synthase III n=1 Tax=Clostridium simiarum TaxID=2841506 RepID=A0ABS6EXK8_9CLOT|nr:MULTISPECIES: beta-ketoacyl-ACP synthase III [Clostridium]MBU5590957.1 ketoacyl-ACP synthase III [Clostridium simiarum]